MTITADAVSNWLPRRFVAQSAQSERGWFEQKFEGTLFLLIKLKSYSDPLALGLEATFPMDAASGAEKMAGLLAAAGQTEATYASTSNRVVTMHSIEDWISTPIALEPRFVAPIRKRLVDGNRFITVGRSYGTDIVLREQSVSKVHAHFEITKDEWVLVDHGSKNHTRVNGEILTGSTQLQPGSIIRFGRVEAKVCSATALWDRIASA